VKPGGFADEERRGRQKRIVMTAAGLFLEHGAENVRMTDIAEACGIGVASLYRYFGTKSAIMLEAGTLLWQDVARLFEQKFHSPEYNAASGFGQVEILLGAYVQLYSEQQPFLRFLNALDAVILAEKPPEDSLKDYRRSIMDFYDLFCRAYKKGEADGSLRPGMDTLFLYRTVTDLLNGAAMKFLRGEVLPEDDYSQGAAEMELFVKMALGYLSGRK
jgi:AcrR family transcriptional regulator